MPGSGHLIFKNTVANTFGLLTGPILSLLLVPFYLHYLGLESYGLIGFFTALQLVLAVFSQGLSMSLQREIARRNADPGAAASLRRLIGSFEPVYFGIALVVAVGIGSASGYFSRSWIQFEQLDPQRVQVALMFIAFRIAASFPHGLYQAVFIGMQRQVLGNTIHVSGAAFSASLAVIAVLIWRNIAALCAAEALAAITLIGAQRTVVFHILPHSNGGARFSWADLAAQWKLSAGLIWTSGSGVLITQMDRLLIARWFPAAALAVYNAGTAGGKLVGLIYGPFLTAIYPETCRLASAGDRAALTAHVMRNARIIAALCMSFGLYLCFFARDILWVWTRNEVIAREGPVVMAVYILGNIAQSYASVFYQLQTAKGTVRYPAVFNAFALGWYPVALATLTAIGGLVGAAASWLLYCGLTLLLLAATSFHRLLDRAAWRRYIALLLGSSMTGLLFMLAARVTLHILHIESSLGRLAIGAPFCIAAFVVLFVSAVGWTETRRYAAAVLEWLTANAHS